jgi:uncharacterized protein YprB with RNaseH-like and TPR domain
MTSNEPQSPEQPDRRKAALFSGDAMARLGKLKGDKLKGKLTTADQLEPRRGPPSCESKAPRSGQSADLASLCPGRVLDGPEGQCYLVEGPVGQFAPEVANVEAAYRRTFLGGGVDATVDALHPSVRPLLETPAEGIAYMDIETCGLVGMPVFQLGLLSWRDGGLHLQQFVARSYAEESAMLARSWEAMCRVRTLVTFNGAAFDVPFIEGRSAATGLGRRTLEAAHVDLLHEARRRWKRMLPNCRLQTIERFICGRLRSGDIPGELIPGVYHEFVRTGDARQIERVLYHNAHDLITLSEIAICVLQNRDADGL